MKKILLVTIQGDNVGNRLQNYALLETLKAEGCEVYSPCLVNNSSFTKNIKNDVKIFLYRLGVKKFEDKYIWKARAKKFAKFSRDHIDNLFRVKYKRINPRDFDKYDYAITGSDQVWHNWSGEADELRYFYLDFMPEEKRIAYAPSFGFDEIPDQYRDIHLAGIKGMNRISCREQSGVELIERETGRKAELVVDPTLLLDKDKWLKLKKQSPLYNGRPFVLIYFLGNKVESYRKAVSEIAVKENLDVIDIYKMSYDSLLTTPDEFIWLIENASYVCTDSFHATVFSILFGKKFMSFRRSQKGKENMFNRIETLLNMYGLTDRIFEGDNISKIYENYSPANIDDIREASLKYLREAIGK